MQRKVFQQELLKQAVLSGFSECEVYYEGGKSFEASIFEGEISQYENSMKTGVCFRGNYQGKTGYAYSEQIAPQAIEFLIEQAKQNAQISEEEKEFLYQGETNYPTITGYQNDLSFVTPQQMLEDAKKMESAALAQGIQAVDTCIIGYEEKEISIQNTKGLDIEHQTNCTFAYLSAIAQDKESIKSSSDYWFGNDIKLFMPEQIGVIVATKAKSHLNAICIESGDYPIILENTVISDILATFCGIFFAENVQKGFSLLKNKINTKIASDCVYLRDNGQSPYHIGTMPFDSEGVSCKNKTVIEQGTLKTLLYNLKSAKKDQVCSTGNGFKPSYQAPVQTACTVFYIDKGNDTKDALITSIQKGLLITEIAGLHSGANTISGDFSLSAEGFLIEDGSISTPIEQITISGNFYELLKNISMIADDLRFRLPSAMGQIGSPSVKVHCLHVSGI